MLGNLYLPGFFKIMESMEKSESKKDTLKAMKKLFKFFDESGDGSQDWFWTNGFVEG